MKNKKDISTLEVLSKMEDDKLFRWFEKNAKFLPRANGTEKYCLRVGTKFLLKNSPEELLDSLKSMVYNYKKQKGE